MDEILFSNYLVMCHTKGCDNAGFSIEIQAAAENPNVICGVCSQAITNLSPSVTVS